MIVVSDTTPISSLLKVGHIEILHSLFSSVVIPPAVRDELTAGFSNDSSLPGFLSQSWVRIVKPTRLHAVQQLLTLLDAGESEAIVLAKELNADRLLIDETDGRRIAIREGLHIIGTAGLLLLAKKQNLIPALKPVLQQLLTSEGFWLNDKIYAQMLRDAGE